MSKMNQRNAKQWSLEELKDLYDLPLMELRVASAAGASTAPSSLGNSGLSSDLGQNRRMSGKLQILRTIFPLSDRGFSATHDVFEEVKEKAKESIEKGTTRICLSVAWREVRNGKIFNQVLEMIKELSRWEWKCAAHWVC